MSEETKREYIRLPIPGFLDYYADNDGHIWSTKRGYFFQMAEYRPQHYILVGLTINGKNTVKTVHSLVALAFHGPCPPGMQVGHKDDNKLDNRPENLIYCTPKENIAASIMNGKMPLGENRPNSKLLNSEA